MVNKYYSASLLAFAILAVIFTWQSIITGGYHSYIDLEPHIDLAGFRADFTSIFKGDERAALDNTKRIVITWIFLFVDTEQFDMVRFAAISFMAMVICYYAGLRFLDMERYRLKGHEKHAIAFVAAFFYRVNPLSVEHFVALYPEISYAIFPAAAYFAYAMFRDPSRKHAIFFAAVSCFLVALVIHNAMYLALMAAAIGAVAVLTKNITPREAVARALGGAVAFLAFSSFMVLPTLYYSLHGGIPQPPYSDSLYYVLQVGKNAEMPRIFLLDFDLHNWPLYWMKYEYPLGGLYYVTMALIAAAAILAGLYWRNMLSMCSGLSIAIFSFLANGIHSPLGSLYQWAIFNIDVGWLLRDSTKFAFVLPLFFALLILHLLAVLASKNKKAFYCIAVIILLHQSIFAWPVWTGNVAGALNKHPAPAGLQEVIEKIKQDVEPEAKVAWFGDYKESSPIGHTTPRQLIENADPGQTVSNLGKTLGLEYLLIDKTPSDEYIDYSYAKNYLEGLEERYTPLYDGEKYVLFKINEDIERLYIPHTVALFYGGYSGINTLSMAMPIELDVAPVVADSEPRIAETLENYTDVVVLDSENVPMWRLEKDNLADFVKNMEGDVPTIWKKTKEAGTTPKQNWDNFLSDNGLRTDQEDFGLGIAYTAKPGVIQDAFFSLDAANVTDGRITLSSPNSFLRIHGTGITDLRAMEVNGTYIQGNATDFWIDADFFSANGTYAGSAQIASGNKISAGFSRYVEIPPGTARFDIRVLTDSQDNTSAFNLTSLAAYPIAPESNTISTKFHANGSGMEDVYLRIFKSPGDGAIGVRFNDGNESIIRTVSDVTGFEWTRIYMGKLGNGTNTLAVREIEGVNAVNIAYHMPDGSRDDYLAGKGIVYAYEAESEFHATGVDVQTNGNFSNGRQLLLSRTSNVSGTLPIYETRRYYAAWAGKDVEVLVDGARIGGEGMMLANGTHRMDIVPTSDMAALDYVLVYDDKAAMLMNQSKNGGGTVLSYEKLGRTSYNVEIDNARPGLLVYTAAYDSSFRAYVNGKEVKPVQLYSINAFPINETGRVRVDIRYEPQELMQAGLLLSALSILAALTYVIRK